MLFLFILNKNNFIFLSIYKRIGLKWRALNFQLILQGYFINDNIIIDKFIDFSNLKSDINFIGKKLMINDDLFKDFKDISANTQYSNKSNLYIDDNTRKIIQDYSGDLFQLYLTISKK